MFCGGIGEHSARVRGAVMDGLGLLGIAGDEARNRARDVDFQRRRRACAFSYRPTNEELMIAEQTAAVGLAQAAAERPLRKR